MPIHPRFSVWIWWIFATYKIHGCCDRIENEFHEKWLDVRAILSKTRLWLATRKAREEKKRNSLEYFMSFLFLAQAIWLTELDSDSESGISI